MQKENSTQMPSERSIQSVVKVGEGRGFVVGGRDGEKYVVTAAHCLPGLPPAGSASDTKERTYGALVVPLGTTEPEIWVECLFADPVSDIAVLGKPDGQVFFDECEAYEKFMEHTAALQFRPVEDGEEAWLLALDGKHWFGCKAHGKRSVWITDATEGIRGGMSGSPILGGDGKVISVVCLSGGTGEGIENYREGGPNPGLANLAGWFLKEQGLLVNARTMAQGRT
jgi:hypothetical protein